MGGVIKGDIKRCPVYSYTRGLLNYLVVPAPRLGAGASACASAVGPTVNGGVAGRNRHDQLLY